MSKLLIAFVLIFSWAAASQGAATTITLQPRSTVKASEMVTLGEIAQIAGPKSDVERLKQVEVARAALPGSARQVTPDWIKTRLSCAGFDTKSITIKSPATVLLVSDSQTAKGTDIGETARTYVAGQLSSSDLTYTFSIDNQPDALAPAGKLELVAEQSDRAIATGRRQVRVDVLVDGVVYTRKNVAVNVKASGLVLVATQAIKAKEPLTASNTRLDQRDIPSTSAGYLTAVPEDGAKMANRPISAGSMITPDVVSARPVISKGDPVMIVVRSGAVKVVTKGTASQDGLIGESIRVRVPTSPEEVQATVAQAGLVEVKI